MLILFLFEANYHLYFGGGKSTHNSAWLVVNKVSGGRIAVMLEFAWFIVLEIRDRRTQIILFLGRRIWRKCGVTELHLVCAYPEIKLSKESKKFMGFYFPGAIWFNNIIFLSSLTISSFIPRKEKNKDKNPIPKHSPSPFFFSKFLVRFSLFSTTRFDPSLGFI